MSIEAARLWKEGMAPWILPSGKYSIGKGAFTGTGHEGKISGTVSDGMGIYERCAAKRRRARKK